MAEDKPSMNMPLEPTLPKGNGSEPGSDSTSRNPSSTPSSRFRTMAMGAMRASQSPSTNGSTTNGSPLSQQPAPAQTDAEKPAPGSFEKSSSSNIDSTTPVSSGSVKSGPLNKSKVIYDIARTKMLTQRTLYRLSTETGYIKLRSKPAPKPSTSGASAVTGHTAEAATAGAHTNGTHAPGTESHAETSGTAEGYKAVVGWKDQGAIDSGKKAPPAAPPSMFDTLAVYVEMVDQSGMWRNCAGVFSLMFLTYVLTALNFGIVGFGIAAVYGSKYPVVLTMHATQAD
ncbi:hypothetical protein H4S01_006451 [Coemansia sp. RSA 2610]|nr:hypothetical protein IWW54_004741 [Coemansia sp. RSA 2705]KAJ2311366.1 hypothetical protein IWW52_005159 [Coemansia sp. RSA 2704]KAJ2357651.1 hypothetical protein H4S01_006451 [Coemansia sp. RSA 2610]